MMNLESFLFGGFIDEHRTKKANLLLARLTEKYGKPRIGTTRACFFSKHFVLKFPINDRGEFCNDWGGQCVTEAELSTYPYCHILHKNKIIELF